MKPLGEIPTLQECQPATHGFKLNIPYRAGFEYKAYTNHAK
jgi:hypothetical protein